MRDFWWKVLIAGICVVAGTIIAVGLLVVMSVMAGCSRPAPRPAAVVEADSLPSQLHVLTVGDSVQVGGVKGEIVGTYVMFSGNRVVVEIQTRRTK